MVRSHFRSKASSRAISVAIICSLISIVGCTEKKSFKWGEIEIFRSGADPFFTDYSSADIEKNGKEYTYTNRKGLPVHVLASDAETVVITEGANPPQPVKGFAF